jgi:hypothetical protein
MNQYIYIYIYIYIYNQHSPNILDKTRYVEGIQILDEIIVAHETIHSLNYSKSGIFIKLNVSKYFDKISWKYMHQSLLAFGICQGQLLSPFLFIFMARVLDQTLKVAFMQRKILGFMSPWR